MRASKDPECGIRSSRFRRIVGGSDAGSWPWQVQILKLNKDLSGYEHKCGGTLINKRWVLTTAGCLFEDPYPTYYKVKIRQYDLSKPDPGEEDISVHSLIIHREFLAWQGRGNDIALIKLNKNVKIGQKVRPVCLPKRMSRIRSGKMCYMTGWGRVTAGSEYSNVLQEAAIPIVSHNKCEAKNNRLSKVDKWTMLCAGYDNKTSGCYGAHNRSKNEMSTQTFGIDKMVVNRRFLTDKAYGYDIALIKLSRPAVLTFAVGLACLPRQGDRVPVGTKCYLTVLGLRLSLSISKVYKIDARDLKFWSDSMDALWWIQRPSRTFKPFVANRIGEIHSYSDPVQWRHVPTKENPADFVTRGLTVEELANKEMWWEGPSFLRKKAPEWPKSQISLDDAVNKEVKIKSLVNDHGQVRAMVTIKEDTPWRIEPIRFSSWLRLTRVQAWIYRFLDNCRLPKAKRTPGELTSEEITDAEVYIIKKAQRESFKEEYLALSEDKELPKHSKLLALKPTLDEDGLLRSDGRLVNADYLPYDTRFPIILPRKNWVFVKWRELAKIMREKIFEDYEEEEIDIYDMKAKEWGYLLREVFGDRLGTGDYGHLTIEHTAMLFRRFRSFKSYSNQGFEALHRWQRQVYSRATNHDSKLPGQSLEDILVHHYAEKLLFFRLCVNEAVESYVKEMLRKRLPQTDNSGLPEPVLCTSTFPNFDDVSEDLVSRTICKSASKSCALDPVPTTLLKDSLGVLLPTITHLINLSLKQGVYPDLFKKALIRPALKKPNLDPEEFSNYRPVANLSFPSKTLERIVAAQLNDYLEHNNLLPKMQSAYRPRHSTETAILRVFNDIQRSIDNRLEVVLVRLDLSSAFDTLDHEILIDRLQHRYGIDDIALRWFKFYLSGRSQAVMINNITSDVRQLPYGVPQGSVLGPVLFSLYFAPLEEVIHAHGLGFMLSVRRRYSTVRISL
ncbi:hypothetical protein QZH41_007175 [Actinostola sp. cb2023]|nr:hypothetical protein QZH41_007175 [Actinostola sp. cb2023]